MADADLRGWERRASGDPATRARLLRERARRGVLARDRLRLAALLGDPAAALACDEPPGPPLADDRALLRWLKRIEAFGPQVGARVLLAAHALAPERVERDPVLRGAAEAWARAAQEGVSAEEARALVDRFGGLAEVRKVVWELCYRSYGGPAPETLSPETWRQGAAVVVDAVRWRVVPWALGEAAPPPGNG